MSDTDKYSVPLFYLVAIAVLKFYLAPIARRRHDSKLHVDQITNRPVSVSSVLTSHKLIAINLDQILHVTVATEQCSCIKLLPTLHCHLSL